MNFSDTLLNIMLHFAPLGYLLCAALLIARRKDGDQSRVMLAVSFIIWGVLMLSSLVFHYRDPGVIEGGVLSIISLNVTFFVLLAMLLYPITVLRGNIKMKIYLFVIGLWVALNVLLLIADIEFREFSSFGEIFDHLGEFNVILRLGIVFVFFLMSFMLFYVPYIYTQSRVSVRWIRWFCIAMQGCTVLYGIWIMTGSDLIRLVMQIYLLAFALAMTYQELFKRIPVEKQISGNTDENGCRKSDIKCAIDSPLWTKMMQVLEAQTLWRNPDLTLVELATIVGTNRTTLSKLIQTAGFDGFYAFVNYCRIKEFISIIEHQKIKSIQETFFDVGFRSKSTALRYFRQETNTTPSEYLQKRLVQPQ